ncbi:MAG: cobalamin-dependent protein [Candidatus Bathyarchaeota archaeon]|nr:cobalamin-dependent protein [Candidatus Bathyarchaeota archaeon]MDH5732431.1 cobalamin-dependent protein [Candidatus Bathyarchaeota archaeon]
MLTSKGISDKLYDAVVSGNIQEACEIAEKIIQEGFSANVALEKMREAMKNVDEKYEQKEYFIVDVASSATAMREAFNILEPYLKVESAGIGGKIVLGSLRGNIQGLGKDIVAATLRAAGLQVVDVGVDISPEVFVDTAIREKAQIIGISISVEETIPFLEDLVEILQQRKLIGTIKTVIGGQAVSKQTCHEYGIDAYAKDAWDCVKKVKQLLANA